MPYETGPGGDALDPHTPIVVGVGQASERLDEPTYQALSPADLGAEAVRAAFLDTKGGDLEALAAAIDTVAGVRQFDTSTPTSPAPLGRANNFPRAVMKRLGHQPRRAVLEVAGGQSPQHLVNELAAEIAAGNCAAAVVVGAEALSTVRHLAGADNAPDWTETVDGDLQDRGGGRKGLTSRYIQSHGLSTPASQYALFEYARRARLGLSRADYARAMGELFAPMSRVAAENPHAVAPQPLTVEELATVTDRNRMVIEPYSRLLMSREMVNQAAAVVLTSVQTAQRLGIPSDRWVFLHGHADLRALDVLDRDDLTAYPAGITAARHALEVAGITLDDIATFDIYSCFPIAVFSICDGLGLDPADPRGLTLTGGLPFFGGAGNNYASHSIAETVQRMRAHPGTYGFVGANGGYQSKYSVGIYSTTARNWVPDRSRSLQAELDAAPRVQISRRANGAVRIESATVSYGRDGSPEKGIVVGRLADDSRVLALVADGDDVLMQQLIDGTACGSIVYAKALSRGNRVAVTKQRLEQLLPSTTPRFRDDYEFITVRRDGHVLEVSINRPEVRNALHPPANDELDGVFDAYFADPDLWVAILTGEGGKAFSAGNDLTYTAAGKPMWIPVNGFAGLTSRPDMSKPVIAAVNGFAYGGGFEIALACHLIVADDTAKFALSEAKVGLAAGAGGLVRLPRRVPRNVAHEMVLTGRPLTADQAQRLGLVTTVAPTGQALQAARELAADIVSVSPTSVRVSLKMMAEAEVFSDEDAAAAAYSRAADEITTSDDMHEGMQAFAQKRAPQWLNR